MYFSSSLTPIVQECVFDEISKILKPRYTIHDTHEVPCQIHTIHDTHEVPCQNSNLNLVISYIIIKMSATSCCELSISNQMSPLRSFYENPFHKNHRFPQGITYKACPRALGGCVDPGVFFISS